MINKYVTKFAKYSQWIVLGAMLLGYFAYMILTPDLTIEEVVKDWQTWVHTVFVIYLNVTMVSVAYDTATESGTSTEEFNAANELNNKLIKLYNLKKAHFRTFVKNLNNHELQSLREEFMFMIGVEDYALMTKKQRRKYNKLRPIFHDIYGFNLPLYYEVAKNGKINYKASLSKNEGKKKRQVTKAFMGLVFSAMTINMSVQIESVGEAITSLIIIASGLLVTFLIIYTPQFNKFKKELPNKVMAKNVLMESFIDYEKGEIKLIELKEKTSEEVSDSLVVAADDSVSSNCNTKDVQV